MLYDMTAVPSALLYLNKKQQYELGIDWAWLDNGCFPWNHVKAQTQKHVKNLREIRIVKACGM